MRTSPLLATFVCLLIVGFAMTAPAAEPTPPAAPPQAPAAPVEPAPGETPGCAEAGVLGVLPGLVGTLQANEKIAAERAQLEAQRVQSVLGEYIGYIADKVERNYERGVISDGERAAYHPMWRLDTLAYGLSCRPVVVSQQPTEPFVTFNFTVSLADFLARIDDLVAQPLVISFPMVMGNVRGDGSL